MSPTWKVKAFYDIVGEYVLKEFEIDSDRKNFSECKEECLSAAYWLRCKSFTYNHAGVCTLRTVTAENAGAALKQDRTVNMYDFAGKLIHSNI